MVGQTLAHYKILEKIGSGGMGDVYLAEDTRLDRKVALKVLPPEVAASEERRARFQREAKAVAALDHPNIVQVFSVEQAEGTHFITMQLVQGKTLTELLPKNGFPLNKFFNIAIPLADAVAAAHQEGITHRDLKPDNVMMGDDGRVKVLDFGLAKPARGYAVNSEGPTVARTDEGVIVGTVNYMSPEQAEGKTVDARSDIFSLGVVFFEMLTGRRPFTGDTPAAVLSAVIRETPPMAMDVNASVPILVARIVRRCLTKEPARRYQTSVDLRNELEELERDLDSGLLTRDFDATNGERRRLARWWIGVGVLSAAVFAWLLGYLPSRDERPHRALELTNPLQLTSAIGSEDGPSWSPDGRAFAYHSNQNGNWDVWISQVGGGQPLNRTKDHDGLDQHPVWSPDGSQIAFFSERDGGGIYAMPVLAGPPKRVSPPGTLARGRPQFSADGTEIAYEVREADESFAEITSLTTGDFRRVKLPGSRLKRPYLSWSPTGRYFAYLDADEPNNPGALTVTRMRDGSAFAVTESTTRDRSPSWSSDEKELYFASRRGGEWDLWRTPITDGANMVVGDAQPVTVGYDAQSAAFSPDGSRLIYSRGRGVANVWRVPILLDRLVTWADATQITFENADINNVEVSPNGDQLVFSSDLSGNRDLRLLSMGTGELRDLTSEPTMENAPSWSPDGREVVFYSNRAGTRDIWVINVGGGPARQLTRHESEDYFPAWSPDGSSVAFSSTRAGGVTIWSVPVEGGNPTRLAETPDVSSPRWSPNGEWLAFSAFGNHVSDRIFVMHRSEREATVVATGKGNLRWSKDGERLFYPRQTTQTAGASSARNEIWSVNLLNRSERRVTDLSGRPGRLGRISVDDENLYYIWNEDVGDIWVMDVVTDEDP